jgi:RND family efflux transporter MFP subunit
MKKAIRWLLAIGLLGAIGGGIWWFIQQRQANTTDDIEVLRTAEAIRDTLEITVATSGSVTLERRVNLNFDRPGTVRQVDVQVGDRVAVGQELAKLDDRGLQDAVRSAEFDLAQAKLNLDIALEPPDEDDIALAKLSISEAAQAMEVAKLSESYAEVRASVDQARARDIEADLKEAYEDYLDILDDFGLPPSYAAGITAQYMEAQGNVGITRLRSDYTRQQAESQWQSAYQRYQQGQQDLEALQEGADADTIRRLELQIDQTEIALEQARADLRSAELIAPIAGIVATVNLQADTATPTTRPAIVLLDDTNTYVNLSIDEIDIGAIEIGQAVSLDLDAYPGVDIVGRVEQIDPLPEITTGITAYPVRVRITDAQGAEIREGMTASARVIVGEKTDVVLVPNWAVRTDQTSAEVFTYCYCIEDGAPKRTPVEIGSRNETWTEVISGLEPGMTIALVTEGQNLLDFQGPPSRGLE